MEIAVLKIAVVVLVVVASFIYLYLSELFMKKWVHNIEVFIDKLIPWLLIILLIILVIEIFFHELALKYHLYIEIADYFIILGFIMDLIFKYMRIRDIPKFLRSSWIEIIAIFPFFLVFRLFESVALFFGGATETASSAQKAVHIGIGVEKEVGEVIREGSKITEEISKASRAERFARFLRPIARSLRLLKFKDKKTRKRLEKNVEKVEKSIEGTIFYEKPVISHRFKK